jgi:tRNA-2-methylthio-N6-dimethylallyladenosine synthase
LKQKRKSRFFVQTFGCQMNVNDSEKVAGVLQRRGLEPAPDAESADFVFINTCAVREKAAQKLGHSLDRLGWLKRRRPSLRIGVGGCVAQLEGDAVLNRSKEVDVLVGPHNIARVPELLEQSIREGRTAVDLDRKADAFAVADSDVAHGSSVRAFVTAMEGCNHVCSFCVVPRTRGPEVHRTPEHILREVEALVARGYPEVMLLGQTVNAYRHGDLDFPGLLALIDRVPGLSRLRFTTSHPAHVNRRMAEALRDLPRLCPYLHLPFQSGSDRILESMRRGHTRQQYLQIIELLREHVPDLALSSDVIVGYPGESAADFEDTLSVLETVGFDSLFAFMYSERPGTTALRLRDDVAPEEKQRRLQVVLDSQQRRQKRQHAERVGRVEEVLVDQADPARRRVSGRTPHFRIVHFDGDEALLGRTVTVQITDSGANSLSGRLAQATH